VLLRSEEVKNVSLISLPKLSEYFLRSLTFIGDLSIEFSRSKSKAVRRRTKTSIHLFLHKGQQIFKINFLIFFDILKVC